MDLVTLILVGKLLEPLWGALEMITFFFVVNAGVGVFSAVFYYFLYMVTFNTELLFSVHIHGKDWNVQACSSLVQACSSLFKLQHVSSF